MFHRVPLSVRLGFARDLLKRDEMDQPKATSANKLLAQASQDVDVLAVILFGSVARGEQTARSDVDICLVLTPERVLDKSVLSRRRLEYLAQFDLDV